MQFHQNRPKIATVGVTTDTHTHTHTHTHRDRERHLDRHASDFIICPTLCYSNGTDK